MLKKCSRLRYLKNKSLRALLISDALILLAAAMLTPIYAVFVKRIGGDVLDVGLTAAALAFGAGFASLVSGRYIDSLRNKKILIVLGYSASAIAFVLYTFVTNVWELALVQIFIGLARPVYEPAFDALYSLHLDKSFEAEEWGAWEGMSYITAGVGALVGAYVVSRLSFDLLFSFMAGLSFISALYVLKLPKSVL